MSKQKNDNFIILEIKVTPKSSLTRLKKLEYPRIEIAICALPEKGKANDELIFYLSKHLNIAKSKIEIISGLTSRNKKIKIILESEQEKDIILKKLII